MVQYIRLNIKDKLKWQKGSSNAIVMTASNVSNFIAFAS